jgi:hypothetical protein
MPTFDEAEQANPGANYRAHYDQWRSQQQRGGQPGQQMPGGMTSGQAGQQPTTNNGGNSATGNPNTGQAQIPSGAHLSWEDYRQHVMRQGSADPGEEQFSDWDEGENPQAS